MVVEHRGTVREFFVVFTDIDPPPHYFPTSSGVRWVNVKKFNQRLFYGGNSREWHHASIGGPDLRKRSLAIMRIMGL